MLNMWSVGLWEEGIEEGKKQGLQNCLLRLLNRRFAPLDAVTLERLHQAKPEQLEQWIFNFHDAKTLAQVWGSNSADQSLQEGLAEILLQQLKRRFTLDESTIGRVVKAKPDQLKQWLGNCYEARTLDQVFAGTR